MAKKESSNDFFAYGEAAGGKTTVKDTAVRDVAVAAAGALKDVNEKIIGVGEDATGEGDQLAKVKAQDDGPKTGGGMKNEATSGGQNIASKPSPGGSDNKEKALQAAKLIAFGG